MARRKAMKPKSRTRVMSARYIGADAIRKMYDRMAHEEDPRIILKEIRDLVYTALVLLGHAKGVTSTLDAAVEDLDEVDDDLLNLSLYLEDDIDEVENGAVYELFQNIRDVSGEEV